MKVSIMSLFPFFSSNSFCCLAMSRPLHLKTGGFVSLFILFLSIVPFAYFSLESSTPFRRCCHEHNFHDGVYHQLQKCKEEWKICTGESQILELIYFSCQSTFQKGKSVFKKNGSHIIFQCSTDSRSWNPLLALRNNYLTNLNGTRLHRRHYHQYHQMWSVFFVMGGDKGNCSRRQD